MRHSADDEEDAEDEVLPENICVLSFPMRTSPTLLIQSALLYTLAVPQSGVWTTWRWRGPVEAVSAAWRCSRAGGCE